jgi:hypothetical protein
MQPLLNGGTLEDGEMAGTSRRKGRVPTAKKRSASTPTFSMRKSKLLDALRHRGWAVRLASGSRKLSSAVATRYPAIPADVEGFLSVLRLCRSPKKTAWFLTVDDYARKRGSGFRWNEIEIMSLEAAEDDLTTQAQIRSLWDGHFPVMLAVHSDYDYLAVRMSDGAIVHGFAPEWEAPSKVAPSFAALLCTLEAEADAQRERWPWKIFVGKGC